MSILSFFAGPIGRWLVVAALLVSFGGFCFLKGVQHEEAHEAVVQLAQEKANQRALADAAAKTKAFQTQKDEALYAANERAKNAEAAADAARAAGDSLRRNLSDTDRVSRASIASLRAYTTTLRAVFAECTKRLEELGREADGHASDSLMYQQAWPQ